jgi:virginiamycin B lyase
MWFTENGADKIGKISPQSSEITEYNIPTENASPDAIVLGPDSNLWFTENGSNKIGKMTPATGVITEVSNNS